MAKSDIEIYFDPIGNPLNMWWSKPGKGATAEESNHADDVMIVNKDGRVVGLEKINFLPREIDPIRYFKGDIKKKLELLFPLKTLQGLLNGSKIAHKPGKMSIRLHS